MSKLALALDLIITFSPVAIAITPLALALTLTLTLAQVRILNQSTHQHIIRLYEVIDSQTNHYLVMECAAHGDLGGHIERCKPSPSPSSSPSPSP